MHMDKKNVVVLGAGFGGLGAAMSIAKGLQRLRLLGKYEVVLVDQHDCHLYTPLLYKMAASAEDYQKKCTYAVSSLVRNLPIRFVESEVTAIDLMNGDVHLGTGEELRADYLVLALGSETNFFGIPGLKENAFQWKTIDDALAVRKAIMKAFAKGGNVNFVAGGAGPNGIELASAVRLWADAAQEENPKLHVSVSLLEAMPTIMTGLSPHAAALAALRLKKLGIAVRTNAKIVGVSQNEISIAPPDASSTNSKSTSAPAGTTSDAKNNSAPSTTNAPEKMPFDVFVWTGGIKTPDMMTGLPIEKDARNKPLAKSDMVCAPGTADLKLAPMVYGLGDSVCFMNPKTGKPVPAVARAAILEAGVVAHNLLEEIKKAETPGYQPKNKVYKPSDYPYVIPIGENWAVAKAGPIVFFGWPASMFEKLIALHYLMGIMPLEDAFRAWQQM